MVFPRNSLVRAENGLRSLREKQNIKDMTSKLFLFSPLRHPEILRVQ